MLLNKHKTNKLILPKHIGIIMDGNGRWAKKRHLPRSAGHAAGSKNFKDIARYANKIGLKHLTVYAFSTENWKRPKDEVDNILNILRDYLKDAKNFKDENIKVKFIGDLSPLADDIVELIHDAELNSADATGLHLNIALNYGGRDEIVHAVREIAREVVSGKIMPAEIEEATIESHLYTAGQPDPDFIIRPSGEYRISNFLIWQSSYAEFWYSNVLWPEFKPKHLMDAIEDYNKRNRRFGGI
ncbi:MAG: isoprenyl transferase [Clostridia bacterium]|nr:isoprenyl transferase [Clostridia bacterium]